MTTLQQPTGKCRSFHRRLPLAVWPFLLRSVALLLLTWNVADCLGFVLESPDGKIHLAVELAERDGRVQLEYAVAFKDTPVIQASSLSFLSATQQNIGSHLRLVDKPAYDSQDQSWQPVYGERDVIRDHYNRLIMQCVDSASQHSLRVEFRCYNTGIAFAATLTASEPDASVHILEEHSEFRFLDDHRAWRTTSAQGKYQEVPLSKLGSNVERPLVVKVSDQCYAAIAEASLVDYAPMKLRRSKLDPHCLSSHLGSSVQFKGKLQTPWRVIMLGSSPAELLENNDLLLNLNEPCAIDDTSWIRPGKVIREITLTTAGAKACVDFAVKHNLQYIEFDAGWYGHEYSEASDATTVTLDPARSKGPFDLHECIEYANQRDIGVLVYVNRRALERQLDELLPLYKKWGIAGVKYGFVNTGTQAWTSWLHEAVRKAAAHELMVDIHDNYRPTGYSADLPEPDDSGGSAWR